MEFCTNCGKKIKKGSKFCASCGAPVEHNDDRKEIFNGEVLKCPNCGEPMKSFQVVCPACGYEIRNTNSSNAVKDFSKKLEQIEATRKPISKVGSLVRSIGIGKSNSVDEQILSHIRNFNVPNTKEDVFEFMILASSNINPSVLSARTFSDAGANNEAEFNAMKAKNDAWIAKVKQVYEKAKISFGTDPDFLKIQDLYEKTNHTIADAKKKKSMRMLLILLPVIIMAVICFGVFFGAGISHSNKEKKLEQTVEAIQIDISNGDYDEALIKAQSLHMDDNWSSESEKHWDEQRKALIKLIEEKKQGE